MNPTEQKSHHTVTATIAVTRLDRLERAIRDERTHRLKLADEQRAYVDGEDRKLRACCQERWDASAQFNQKITADFYALRCRGFWARLNWLLTGR